MQAEVRVFRGEIFFSTMKCETKPYLLLSFCRFHNFAFNQDEIKKSFLELNCKR